MENRIIEIARKKAHNQQGKNQRADWNAKANTPAFFTRSDLQSPPRFPADIKPERRPLSVDAATALIMAAVAPKQAGGKAAAQLAPPSTIIAPKPVAKRKAAAKKPRKPRVKAKIAQRAAPKTPRTKPTSAPAVAPPLAVAPQPDVAPPVPQRVEAARVYPQPTTPLPRAKAVAVYRKNGMLDVLSYWLRTQFSDIAKRFGPRTKTVKSTPNVAQVLAENAALRAEIARLRAAQ